MDYKLGLTSYYYNGLLSYIYVLPSGIIVSSSYLQNDDFRVNEAYVMIKFCIIMYCVGVTGVLTTYKKRIVSGDRKGRERTAKQGLGTIAYQSKSYIDLLLSSDLFRVFDVPHHTPHAQIHRPRLEYLLQPGFHLRLRTAREDGGVAYGVRAEVALQRRGREVRAERGVADERRGRVEEVLHGQIY